MGTAKAEEGSITNPAGEPSRPLGIEHLVVDIINELKIQPAELVQPLSGKKDVEMTGKYPPPEVTIRSYPDSPICDVVVVVRGQEMILRCRDYRQAMRWARLERKTYKIPEPDTGFPANDESRDLPLFLHPDRN